MCSILLFIVSLNALVAGYRFITDLTGTGMELSAAYLHNSPFSNETALSPPHPDVQKWLRMDVFV
ncbi:hypothetical protein [Daejeonella sp.]|uniref:hypothetical protein n=1 Tax=Daejeonella sp. TaxID=2805397 RepID=UPI0039837088